MSPSIQAISYIAIVTGHNPTTEDKPRSNKYGAVTLPSILVLMQF